MRKLLLYFILFTFILSAFILVVSADTYTSSGGWIYCDSDPDEVFIYDTYSVADLISLSGFYPGDTYCIYTVDHSSQGYINFYFARPRPQYNSYKYYVFLSANECYWFHILNPSVENFHEQCYGYKFLLASHTVDALSSMQFDSQAADFTYLYSHNCITSQASFNFSSFLSSVSSATSQVQFGFSRLLSLAFGSGTTEVLQTEYSELFSRYTDLYDDYNDLLTINTDLGDDALYYSEQLSDLNEDYAELQADYDELVDLVADANPELLDDIQTGQATASRINSLSRAVADGVTDLLDVPILGTVTVRNLVTMFVIIIVIVLIGVIIIKVVSV